MHNCFSDSAIARSRTGLRAATGRSLAPAWRRGSIAPSTQPSRARVLAALSPRGSPGARAVSVSAPAASGKRAGSGAGQPPAAGPDAAKGTAGASPDLTGNAAAATAAHTVTDDSQTAAGSADTAGSAGKAGGQASGPAKAGVRAGGDGESIPLRELLPELGRYLWPEGRPWLKARVAFALSLLLGAKLLTIQVPFLFKDIVDRLSPETVEGLAAADKAMLAVPLALLLGCESRPRSECEGHCSWWVWRHLHWWQPL